MYLDRVIENGRTNLAGLKKGHLFQDFFLYPDMLYFLPFFRLQSPSLAAYKDTKICSCILFKFKANKVVSFLGVFRHSTSRVQVVNRILPPMRLKAFEVLFLSLAASDGVELGKIHKVPVSRNPKRESHIAYSVNFVIFCAADVTERHLSLVFFPCSV